MKLQTYKNTKTQGDAGLGIAIAYFAVNGYPCMIPLTDNQPYDLVVDYKGKLIKVQVKTVTYKGANGIYKCSLTTKGGNRSGNKNPKKLELIDVDYIFIVTGEGDKYFIPYNKVMSQINLGKLYEKYKVDLY